MTEKNKMKSFDISVEEDDLLDEALTGMPGLRVAKDTAQKAAAKPAQKQNVKHTTQIDKPKAAGVGKYASDVPNNGPRFSEGIEGVKKCAKTTFLFGGLSLLFFYWQQTGQMLPSASFPSIIVCVLLAGIGIGKAVGKHIKW